VFLHRRETKTAEQTETEQTDSRQSRHSRQHYMMIVLTLSKMREHYYKYYRKSNTPRFAMFAFTCILLILVVVASFSNAFTASKQVTSGLCKARFFSQYSMSAAPPPELDQRTRERIQTLVGNNKVLLFMKGNKLFPQCGFSNTACR